MSESCFFSQEATETDDGAWALYPDNAAVHAAHSIQLFLTSDGISVVQQPPYSPDISPCQFWFFPQQNR